MMQQCCSLCLKLERIHTRYDQCLFHHDNAGVGLYYIHDETTVGFEKHFVKTKTSNTKISTA